jgi:uncharacterized iron-regulated membrane protein
MTPQAPVAARTKPLLPPQFVQAMLAGHSALGLAFAALIYVVCASGTLSVFLHELRRWEQPNGPLLSQPVSIEKVQSVVRAAYEQAHWENAAHDIFLMAEGPLGPRFFASYHDHESGVEGNWLADDSGRLAVRANTPWSDFIGSLHMHLHLPRTWGLFLVGLTGVALLSSLISGLLSHPRIFKDAFALRWGGSRRLQEADLHNRLGVWGLPFHFAVSLTGALLGLSTLIVGVLALAAYDGNSEKAFAAILGPLPTESIISAPVPDVAAMMRHVLAEKPEAVFSSVQLQHIGTAGQVVHLGMRMPGHLAMANTYYFDGAGKPLGDGGLETGGVGQQILGALQPLHFGWFGGLGVKLIYDALGLALTYVAQSGVTIWLARRHDKGRAVPGWERVWAAVVWSQPFAFGVTALAGLLLNEAALLPAYLVALAESALVASLAADARTTTRVLRLLGAASLAATAIVHWMIWQDLGSDPMASAVNAVFLIAALLIAAPVFRVRSSFAPA